MDVSLSHRCISLSLPLSGLATPCSTAFSRWKALCSFRYFIRLNEAEKVQGIPRRRQAREPGMWSRLVHPAGSPLAAGQVKTQKRPAGGARTGRTAPPLHRSAALRHTRKQRLERSRPQ